MSTQLAQLQEATIKQHCKALRMPMMGMQFSSLAEQAVKEKKTHTGYLEALLTAEIEGNCSRPWFCGSSPSVPSDFSGQTSRNRLT